MTRPSFSHCYTDMIVCPYCGWKDRDSAEFLDGKEGGDEYECGECERAFRTIRHVEVKYTTLKEPDEHNPEHQRGLKS